MKIIESKAELLQQSSGLEGVYKQIELCGRTCYKSTDKMTEDSAKPFVERMIASRHTAMLEQGTVYLKIPYNLLHRVTHIGLCKKYVSNPYCRVQEFYEYVDTPIVIPNEQNSCNIVPYLAVTTNLRVMVENGWLEDLEYLCEPTKYHEKRYTMRFVTDRGVSHELVRHRVFSFAQESTRYCNYSKDKFGGEISYIMPSWFPEANMQQQEAFMQIMKATEDYYMALLGQWDERKPDARFKTGFKDNPLTPQQARQVLPNALKTEVCMTGFASDWRFFFDLRYYGETGKPHPDMELLASKARGEFIKAGLWDEIMSYQVSFNNESISIPEIHKE